MTAPTFVTSLASFGDRVALVDDQGTRLSYSQLSEQVDAVTASLGQHRRLVMVELASKIPSVIAYLAALRGGHAVIVAKPGDVKAKGSIYTQFRPSAVHVAETVGFSVVHDDDPELHTDLAALYSTSGSTGSAKLVRLSASNLQANAESIATYLEIDDTEIAPTSLPLSYSYGASVLSSHLSRGARLILTEHSVVDPEFEALFEREQCTSLSGVPYTWELLEQVSFLSREWPHLRTLTQAGGKMPAQRVTRLANWARDTDKRLFVMYGQTECTARMSYLPWEHTLEHSDCIGIAIPGGRFHLIDEDGSTVEGPDTRGELVYAGPNVMMGYATGREDLALSAETDERRTGDLAERNELDLYRIVGRLSRFSKIMGLRISLDEVEAMVKRAGPQEPAIAGNDDLIALCIKRASADAAQLEADVATECGIPPNAVVAVEVDGELPHLDNGKVDYTEILELAQAIADKRESQTVSLRAEIAGLLGLDNIPDGESFSSLGGDSLTYIQASFAIERRLGDLPPNWEHLPIGTLEAYESGGGPGAGAGTSDDGKAGGGVSVDMDVLLRAIAITFVVFNHTRPTGLPVAPGAMATLLLLAGQNLARFRSDSLFRGEGLALVRSTFTRYMLPYMGILWLYLLAKRDLDIPSLLLFSTFVDPRAGTFLEPFWFIEVFFHITLLMAGFFAIAPLRSSVAARPFAWGVGGFAILGGLHVASNQTGLELPPVLLWSGIFTLGWCVHFAQTTTQRVLLTLSCLAMPWLTPRGLNVAVVMPIVIWLPRVRLFVEPLKWLVGRVGSSTFQVYILHTVVLTSFGMIPGVRGSWLFPLVVVPLSLGAGIALNALPTWRSWLPARWGGNSEATG